jgi:type II secretory pathway pseudopilin PulG
MTQPHFVAKTGIYLKNTLDNIQRKFKLHLRRQRSGWDLPSPTLAETSSYYPIKGVLDKQKLNKFSWLSQSGAGFTLIETIISVIVIAGMTLVVVNIFISANTFFADEQQRIQVGETAARALATLDDTLREGRLILASGVVDGITHPTNDTTLVLALPSVVGGVLTSANDTVVITRNTATNILEELTAPSAGSTRPAGSKQLATGVNDVYFRYTTDDPASSTAVTVVVSSTKTVNKRPFTKTILLYETLRNHP